VFSDFFQPKKLLKALRYQLKVLKAHFELRFGLIKKMPALMHPWVTNMNGKNYYKRKKESMPITLPET
jgi:hypothetical protein